MHSFNLYVGASFHPLFAFILQITSRVQQGRNSFCLVLDNPRECWQLFKVIQLTLSPSHLMGSSFRYDLSRSIQKIFSHVREMSDSRWVFDGWVAKNNSSFRPREMQSVSASWRSSTLAIFLSLHMPLYVLSVTKVHHLKTKLKNTVSLLWRIALTAEYLIHLLRRRLSTIDLDYESVKGLV